MRKENETYSIAQVSLMTGVNKNRIREWHAKGFLPGVRWISVGGRRHRRFTQECIKMIQETERLLKQGFILKVAATRSREALEKE
jgi:DNA-binding transcriptional MerR regulator